MERPADDRRVRADLRAHAAAVRPAAGRALRRDRPLRGRRRAARARPAEAGGHPQRGCGDGHRRHDRRSRPTRLGRPPGQHVVRPLSEPIKPTGGFAILRGNVAPDGCVVKLSGHERRKHTGPARVFDGEEAAMAAVLANEIEPGDVIVIRAEGPAGGPGMREMLAVTAAIVGEGLGEAGGADHRRALLRRHARLHGRPRRAGGRARAVRSRRCADGDELTIDVDAGRLDVALSSDQNRRARGELRAPAARRRAHRRRDPQVRQARRQRRPKAQSRSEARLFARGIRRAAR